MSESISADKLAREIMRQMEEYTEEVKETTHVATNNALNNFFFIIQSLPFAIYSA